MDFENTYTVEHFDTSFEVRFFDLEYCDGDPDTFKTEVKGFDEAGEEAPTTMIPNSVMLQIDGLEERFMFDAREAYDEWVKDERIL